MPKTRNTWREKLEKEKEKEQEPKVVDIPAGRLPIPKPLDVDRLIGKIQESPVV